jgi:hypothetical protein
MPTGTRDRRLLDLLASPPDQHDLAWLKSSLQLAVELELSTLPPYLCGMWSCQDQGSAYGLIQTVVLQEMLHMGLAANMLTTIGGTPAINTSVPSYPGPLPGGVMPDLTVYLGGLTKAYVGDVYMTIEYPDSGPITPPPTQETIGQFYAAISDAFGQVQPTCSGENQLTASIGNDNVSAIQSVTEAQQAISLIKEQGEGTATSPDDGDAGEFAHYYRFGEIFNGALLVQVDGKWAYSGDAVPFPATYPMAQVPKGGWPNPPSNVTSLLQTFDQAYKTVLDSLQSAWQNGSQGDLDNAVGAMFGLGGTAGQLMQIQLPDGSGNYGPDFIYPSS